jgi:hypothetical protein
MDALRESEPPHMKWPLAHYLSFLESEAPPAEHAAWK